MRVGGIRGAAGASGRGWSKARASVRGGTRGRGWIARAGRSGIGGRDGRKGRCVKVGYCPANRYAP